MHSGFCKVLVVAAAVGAAQPTFANVITDWDEKAIAVVTPMAPLGGTSADHDDFAMNEARRAPGSEPGFTPGIPRTGKARVQMLWRMWTSAFGTWQTSARMRLDVRFVPPAEIRAVDSVTPRVWRRQSLSRWSDWLT